MHYGYPIRNLQKKDKTSKHQKFWTDISISIINEYVLYLSTIFVLSSIYSCFCTIHNMLVYLVSICGHAIMLGMRGYFIVLFKLKIIRENRSFLIAINGIDTGFVLTRYPSYKQKGKNEAENVTGFFALDPYFEERVQLIHFYNATSNQPVLYLFDVIRNSLSMTHISTPAAMM